MGIQFPGRNADRLRPLVDMPNTVKAQPRVPANYFNVGGTAGFQRDDVGGTMNFQRQGSEETQTTCRTVYLDINISGHLTGVP